MRSSLFLWLLIPYLAMGGLKSWTGNSGNGLWSDPMNWTDGTLPGTADDILLDNTEFPGSYQIRLPDQAVTIRTINISPADGNTIELILPSSNKEINALTVTGPGYGILLNAGAIFRNASGISSGESLFIADSLRINDGGRYIHNTRASHANGILRILSTAPGTEKGVFEFDVPRASYTISVSNRTYGCLSLSSASFGSKMNYTCSGSNPLTIRGDLRIGINVNLSVDLNGSRGNIALNGDFIQEGGTLNLASGAGNRTVLQLKGDFVQSPGGVVTATSTSDPAIEMEGIRPQMITAGGSLINDIVLRINNPMGCKLLSPLSLPYRLELLKGNIISSNINLLNLGAGCSVQVDSAQVTGAYVDGPVRKEGLIDEAHFLFPTGKSGCLRWLELKQASGNFTVEYIDENPASLGFSLGNGIDHLSKMEYWKVATDGPLAAKASVELSFATPQSGGVTDPTYLNVAGISGGQWLDEGHAALTGGSFSGSVLSSSVNDFSGQAFTLASTVNLENPLPLTTIRFQGQERNGYAEFSWTLASPEIADHFELLEIKEGKALVIAQIPANENQKSYLWKEPRPFQSGSEYYKLNMEDRYGNVYSSNTIKIPFTENKGLKLEWLPGFANCGRERLHISSPEQDNMEYCIVSMAGGEVKRGKILIPQGDSDFILPVQDLGSGIYQLQGLDSKGRVYGLRLLKN
jgi:hypothetical protein